MLVFIDVFGNEVRREVRAGDVAELEPEATAA
jgi:hypothetical protein